VTYKLFRLAAGCSVNRENTAAHSISVMECMKAELAPIKRDKPVVA
jgi:hypothetical protein